MLKIVMDSDIAQASGWSAVITSIMVSIMDWASDLSINEILQGFMYFGSSLFLYYKIVGQRLDVKIKRKIIKEDEEDEQKKDNKS